MAPLVYVGSLSGLHGDLGICLAYSILPLHPVLANLEEDVDLVGLEAAYDKVQPAVTV